MAYFHGQREIVMTTSGGVPYISATGDLFLRAAPGYQPFVVRAISVQSMTTIAPTIAPVISFFESSAAGATSGSWTAIDTITVTTAAVQGQVFFVEDLATKIEPGHEVTADVTTVTTEAAMLRMTLYVDATTDAPPGNTQMTESA